LIRKPAFAHLHQLASLFGLDLGSDQYAGHNLPRRLLKSFDCTALLSEDRASIRKKRLLSTPVVLSHYPPDHSVAHTNRIKCHLNRFLPGEPYSKFN
jgi:hypothetical protein